MSRPSKALKRSTCSRRTATSFTFPTPRVRTPFFSCIPTGANIPCAVHASVPSNTFALYGHGEDKELTELVPGILNQLGPDSLASLRKLAESYQSMQRNTEGGKADGDDDDDDDIPDLVAGETFDAKKDAADDNVE